MVEIQASGWVWVRFLPSYCNFFAVGALICGGVDLFRSSCDVTEKTAPWVRSLVTMVRRTERGVSENLGVVFDVVIVWWAARGESPLRSARNGSLSCCCQRMVSSGFQTAGKIWGASETQVDQWEVRPPWDSHETGSLLFVSAQWAAGSIKLLVAGKDLGSLKTHGEQREIFHFSMVASCIHWEMKYSGGLVIGPPAHRANPVIGPGKGLHQVSAIKGELWEIWWIALVAEIRESANV